MRKNWLLIGVGLLVAVLAIGAIACGDDDDNGNGDGNGGDIGDIGDIGDGNGNGNGDLLLRLSVTLTEMDGSGTSGTAELTVSGDGIQVTLSMAGLEEGVHANHLHHGTCESPGEIHITLLHVVADATGDATATTTDGEQPLSHFETGHYLAVHEAGGAPGAVVSCGDVVA